MDEPPQKPGDEPSEELVDAWTIYNLRMLAEQQARSGRLPPVRSATPAPRLLTPTPEPRAAEASQGKDRSWTPEYTAASPSSPSEVPDVPPPGEPELTPEQIAKADGAVDRALAKPLRARS